MSILLKQAPSSSIRTLRRCKDFFTMDHSVSYLMNCKGVCKSACIPPGLLSNLFGNMCVLSCKKSTNCWNSIFHECGEKIIKHYTNNFFSVFEDAICKKSTLLKKVCLAFFQSIGPLGRCYHRVAMCVCLFVCLSEWCPLFM